MANTYATNPIKIDTAFSTSYKANGGMPTSGALYLDEIYWYKPVTPGTDTFTMNDNGGNTLRQGQCETANISQKFSMYGRMISDFSVPTLSSGILYIYYH